MKEPQDNKYKCYKAWLEDIYGFRFVGIEDIYAAEDCYRKDYDQDPRKDFYNWYKDPNRIPPSSQKEEVLRTAYNIRMAKDTYIKADDIINLKISLDCVDVNEFIRSM